MRAVVLVLALVMLAFGAAAASAAAPAAAPQFSLSDIEGELMCPTCQSRLDLSHSPAADRIRRFVEAKRRQGWSKEQVKDALVADFGPAVLAAPPAAGFGLVAWLVPGVGILVGVMLILSAGVLWRRRAQGTVARPPRGRAADVDARIDEALRRLDDDDR